MSDSFEAMFHPNLQISAEEKKRIICHRDGWRKSYLYYGMPIAESYGATPKALYEVLGEEIPGMDPKDGETQYIYSTAVLPQYQGSGMGSRLISSVIEHLRTITHRVMGHATNKHILHIHLKQGAKVIHEYTDWYGTGLSAFLYEYVFT